MSDADIRFKRSKKLRMEKIKVRHNQGDLRGAFATKAIDPRKGEYKRTKIRLQDIADERVTEIDTEQDYD